MCDNTQQAIIKVSMSKKDQGKLSKKMEVGQGACKFDTYFFDDEVKVSIYSKQN